MSNIKRVLLSGMLLSSLTILPISAFASYDNNNETWNKSKEKNETDKTGEKANSNKNNAEIKNGNGGIGSGAYNYYQSKRYKNKKTAYDTNANNAEANKGGTINTEKADWESTEKAPLNPPTIKKGENNK